MKKRNVKIWSLLFFVGILFSFQVDPPDDIRIKKILKQLAVFNNDYKQQKVYIHTDKDTYLAGENIWIKSYLLEASSLLPDSLSKEIYVDFIDFNNKHVLSIIVRNNKGFGQGNILLRDTLAEGNYQIRAYTNWMRNFDEDFFYNKTVKISNPNYENIVTNKRLSEIKRFNKGIRKLKNQYSIHFFPEGGDLVNGFKSKVAFKAENKLGEGVKVSGTIYSDKNEKITEFSSVHQGMGFFSISPVKGRKYYAKLKFGSDETSKIALPEILERGVVISADPFQKDYIQVTLHSNRSISENIASNEVILVGQARGEIMYISKGEIRDKPLEVSIPKRLFPAGIVQLTIFDARGEPLCERLVFMDVAKELEQNNIKLIDRSTGDSLFYILQISDPEGVPVQGNLSLSFREKLINGSDSSQTNILTHLLLTSDLKGRIENPGFYFSGNPKSDEYLDLVMLTHGWRRFDWKKILQNNFPKILHQPSLGIAIGGKITRDFFDIPVPNSKVRLSILSSFNDVFETTTDQKGRFLFANLDYEDTMDVKIEAFKPSGGKGVLIQVGDTVVPDIVTYTNPELRKEIYKKELIKANNRRERIEFKKGYKGRPEPDNQMFKIHNTPNDVIFVGEDVANYSNILDYMQGRVPGVNITGNRVIIRGINTFYGSTDPLFLLDGVPIDASAVPSLNPLDIAIIEVLKGPEAAIYGSRGANGVIAFFSRRGEFMKRGVIDFGMLGYHKVRQFYVPDYDNWNYKPQNFNIPRTIYWNPEIKTDSRGFIAIKYKNKLKTESQVLQIEGITNNGEILYFRKEY
jgi:TonB-dependent SusC/RagA subfamily outer membrane receptor